MEHKITLKKLIHAPREIVFKYWTDPVLVEKWATPRDMTLKIPYFDARTGGKYRYEHRGSSGTIICHGRFEEFIPEHKLSTTDHVETLEGMPIFDRIETKVTFMDDMHGTAVMMYQTGFPDEKARSDCELALEEAMTKLVELIENMRFRPGQELRAHHVRGD